MSVKEDVRVGYGVPVNPFNYFAAVTGERTITATGTGNVLVEKSDDYPWVYPQP